jgi:hypothetical protein
MKKILLPVIAGLTMALASFPANAAGIGDAAQLFGVFGAANGLVPGVSTSGLSHNPLVVEVSYGNGEGDEFDSTQVIACKANMQTVVVPAGFNRRVEGLANTTPDFKSVDWLIRSGSIKYAWNGQVQMNLAPLPSDYVGPTKQKRKESRPFLLLEDKNIPNSVQPILRIALDANAGQVASKQLTTRAGHPYDGDGISVRIKTKMCPYTDPHKIRQWALIETIAENDSSAIATNQWYQQLQVLQATDALRKELEAGPVATTTATTTVTKTEGGGSTSESTTISRRFVSGPQGAKFIITKSPKADLIYSVYHYDAKGNVKLAHEKKTFSTVTGESLIIHCSPFMRAVVIDQETGESIFMDQNGFQQGE